ncbi:MAG: metal ABC transporter permease [Fervidicoccaceae archaeon]
MRRLKLFTALSITVSTAIPFIFKLIFPSMISLVWIVVLLSSAISFAVLSTLIAARNLYFLAGSIPHSALFSASFAMLISFIMGGSSFVWSLLINTALILAVGYVIHSGADPNKVTSIFVGMTASLTVTVLYYLVNHFYVAKSITSEILGDPFLSTTADAYISLASLAFTLIAFFYSYRENILIGLLGRESWLSGINVYLHDYVFYLLLAVVSASFMKIIGFILTHIFILIPGAIASIAAERSNEAVSMALGMSLLSASIGLVAGIALNLSPAGITGIIMMIIYVLLVLMKKVK